MDIEIAAWEALEPHLCIESRNPPKPVYEMAAQLVDPHDIKGSWTTFVTNGQSTWGCWLVTSTALAHAEIEFAAIMYDSHDEASRARDHLRLPPATIKQAWKRPLAGIIELRIGGLPVDDVHLAFADKVVKLPGRPPAYGGPRDPNSERFQKFLAAITDALEF
jgi:hypothetical protein